MLVFIGFCIVSFIICSALVKPLPEDKKMEDEEQMKWLREYNKKYLK